MNVSSPTNLFGLFKIDNKVKPEGVSVLVHLRRIFEHSFPPQLFSHGDTGA